VAGKVGLGLGVWVLSLYLDAVPASTAEAYPGYSKSRVLPDKFSKSRGGVPFSKGNLNHLVPCQAG